MIPKAELHCHLEGSVPPELARELAARNGLELPANLFGPDGHYIWRDFLSFLDAYDRVCGVLRSRATSATSSIPTSSGRQPRARSMSRYSARPSGPRGWAFPMPPGSGRCRCDRSGAPRFGIEARIIGICVRHLGPERALALAQQMVAEPHPYVVALGMGGDEARFAPADFAPAYRLAHENGLGCTVHAGEVVGPESVWAAIRDLPVTRIGHGVRSIEDAALVEELARRGDTAGSLPGQQRGTRPVSQSRRPSVATLDRSGVRVTLGSDDPPFFHTTLGTEYDEAGLGEPVLRTITRTAIEASFADEATKVKLLKGVQS